MGNRVEAILRAQIKTFSDSVIRPADTDAYEDGDVIAAVTTNDYFTFGDADTNLIVNRGAHGLHGMIVGARLFSSQDNQTLKLDATLWLFNSAITEDADNAAFTPTDAELLACVGTIDFAYTDWLAGTRTSGAGGNAFCPGSRGGNLEFELPFRATDDLVLYGILQARNAYAPIASEELTVQLDVVAI